MTDCEKTLRENTAPEPIVLDDEALESLTDNQKAKWNGYVFKMTYENWDEEAIEAGDTDDKGWECEGSDTYLTLYDLINCIRADASWTEWSDSNPSARSWISSYGEMDPHSGIRTNNSLWIERADGIPMSEEEIIYISRQLGLRHPKIERK